MAEYKDIVLNTNSKIGDAISLLNKSGKKIVFIIDDQESLVGIITDGDIRRAILNNSSLEDPVSEGMNKDFYFSYQQESLNKDVIDLISSKKITHLPILNHDRQIVEIIESESFDQYEFSRGYVLIMAGGKGTRLMPLTKNCPKPLLEINGRPMLEHLIINCKKRGLKKFFISVNYLKEQIIEYFGDGSSLGVKINYLVEDKPLGTGGALTLIKEKLRLPLLVVNSDVVSNIDFLDLIKFHLENKSNMTICVQPYTSVVPFGVVETENLRVKSLREKPSFTNYINAGIYVISPEVINDLEIGRKDMTEIIEDLLIKRLNVAAFPIYESWADVGMHNELSHVKENWRDYID